MMIDTMMEHGHLAVQPDLDNLEDEKKAKHGSSKKKAINASHKFRSSLRSKRGCRSGRIMSALFDEDFNADEFCPVDAFQQALILEELLPARFLRARKFDIEKTKMMWANMLTEGNIYSEPPYCIGGMASQMPGGNATSEGEMVAATLKRVEAMEQELSATKKALEDSLVQQDELLDCIKREEEKKRGSSLGEEGIDPREGSN